MLNDSITHKIVGYFSYTLTEDIFCYGDACIIAGTEELMRFYVEAMNLNHKEADIVEKTKFGEIIRGIKDGAAYAFDKEAYTRFFPLAKKYGLDDLSVPKDCFLEPSKPGLHFIRIQFDNFK